MGGWGDGGMGGWGDGEMGRWGDGENLHSNSPLPPCRPAHQPLLPPCRPAHQPLLPPCPPAPLHRLFGTNFTRYGQLTSGFHPPHIVATNYVAVLIDIHVAAGTLVIDVFALAD